MEARQLRVYKTKVFARFARKEHLSDLALWEAIVAAEVKPDADLGGGLIKQRIARTGSGKSGGYRTIIAWRRGGLAFFIYGFPKSSQSNITQVEERALRRFGGLLLKAEREHLDHLVEIGELLEVIPDDRWKG